MDQTNGGRRLKTFKNRTEPVQKRVAKSQKISIFNPEYLKIIYFLYIFQIKLLIFDNLSL